jgi:hypothetical protein
MATTAAAHWKYCGACASHCTNASMSAILKWQLSSPGAILELRPHSGVARYATRMNTDRNGWTLIRSLGIGLLLMAVTAVASDTAAWHGSFLPAQIGGWKAAGPARTYGRSDIFDYMDGAGELYLAYDFQEVAVRDYKKAGVPGITAEVYKMASPREAYGIWTSEQGPSKNAKEVAAVGQDRDYGVGLLRFWKGPYFARILAERETPESKNAVLALGKLISSKITSIGRRPDILKLLPRSGLIPESVRFFHKHTVLNYQFYLSDANILDLGPKTDAILAQYKLDGAKPRLLVVRYPTEKAAAAAYASFNKAYFKSGESVVGKKRIGRVEKEGYTGIELAGRTIRVVFQAKNPWQAELLLRD